MSIPEEQRDERLVDLLDESLTELQSGKSLDADTWCQVHPEFAEEGPQLLATLQHLVEAAEDWRQISRTVVLDSPTADYHPEAPELAFPEVRANGTAHTPVLPSSEFGRYRILARIGAGGMATVYRAHDPQLNRIVAIKVPRVSADAPDHARFVERFLREARTAATVRHSHVCPIYDVGEKDGRPYVVMAYVEGESLSQQLRRMGPFVNVRAAVNLICQIAEALGTVHSHGIIHRDLKPGNILIEGNGHAVLTDFGLALQSQDEERLSTSGLVVGTPSYMAPEQVLGEGAKLGPATDLYSLGVVLYEMLTGRVPFKGGSVSVILHKITYEDPPIPSQFRPALDPRLGALIMQALAKEPEQRPQSAQAFSDSLRSWLESAPAVTDTPVEQPPGAHSTPRRRWWRTRRGLVAAAAVLVACVGAFTTAALWNGDGAGRRDSGDPALAVNKPFAFAQPLNGNLIVTISSDRDLGPITKRHLPVDQRGALPVRNGELVYVEARLNRPAYSYLLWIDSRGAVQAVYPWDIANSAKGWRAPWVADGDQPHDVVRCPAGGSRGLIIEGPPGLETVVLLARSQPLPDGFDLEEVVGKLPPSSLSQPGEVVWLGQLPGEQFARHERDFRGVTPGKSKEMDAPIFQLLEERLRPHFELMKAVRFAHGE
jgi:tRNA A-37 threonylcarbamoyl transferase component Bud32